jgi:hypothetical protein
MNYFINNTNEVLELERQGYNPYSIAYMTGISIDNIFKILRGEYDNESFDEESIEASYED